MAKDIKNMVTSELLQFIEQENSNGKSATEIKSALSAAQWSEADIDEAISKSILVTAFSSQSPNGSQTKDFSQNLSYSIVHWRAVKITLTLFGLLSLIVGSLLNLGYTAAYGLLLAAFVGLLSLATLTRTTPLKTSGPTRLMLVNGTVLLLAFFIGSIAADYSTGHPIGPYAAILLGLPALFYTPIGWGILGIASTIWVLFFVSNKIPRVRIFAQASSIVGSCITAVAIYLLITSTGP